MYSLRPEKYVIDFPIYGCILTHFTCRYSYMEIYDILSMNGCVPCVMLKTF